MNYGKIIFIEHISSQTQRSFMKKMKQIYVLNIFSQQNQKHKQKEFGNSSNL